jgi:uncharacterized protein (TIGR02147 family)
MSPRDITSNSQPSGPAETLRSIFLERKARNPTYSTRAFARDLGMSQGLLSLVLSGKQPLSVKQALKVAVLLELPDVETFMQSVLMALPEDSKAVRLLKRRQASKRHDGSSFVDRHVEQIEETKLISQWYHLPILDLTTNRGFKSDVHWIARRLGIGPIETRDAVDRLLKLGLLERREGKLRKTTQRIQFRTRDSQAAVRAFHKQMIQKALAQLEKSDAESFAAREISSMTIAMPRALWPECQRRIQKFQKELAEFASQGESDSVYQLNVQMFSLTGSPGAK